MKQGFRCPCAAIVAQRVNIAGKGFGAEHTYDGVDVLEGRIVYTHCDAVKLLHLLHRRAQFFQVVAAWCCRLRCCLVMRAIALLVLGRLDGSHVIKGEHVAHQVFIFVHVVLLMCRLTALGHNERCSSSRAFLNNLNRTCCEAGD